MNENRLFYERETPIKSNDSLKLKAFEYCEALTTIKFEGTIEQWNAITKGTNWKYGVPATYVQCSDGIVTLH